MEYFDTRLDQKIGNLNAALVLDYAAERCSIKSTAPAAR